jgi:hypothetical protein
MNENQLNKTSFAKRVIKGDDVLFEIEKFSCYRVVTEAQKKIAYSLRYKAYIADNQIEPRASGLFFDEYDDKENSFTYIVEYNGEPIGSIRACVYSKDLGWLDIPAFHVYKDSVEGGLDLNKSFMEINKFVILSEYRRQSTRGKLRLFRKMVSVARKYGVYYVLAGIKASQARFYSILFFEKISDFKDYPLLKFKPALFVSKFGDYDRLYDEQPKEEVFSGIRRYILE